MLFIYYLAILDVGNPPLLFPAFHFIILASTRQIIEQLQLSDRLADIYEQTKIQTDDTIETIHGKLYQRIQSLSDYKVRLNLINETQQSKIYEYKHKEAELELQHQYLNNLLAKIKNNKSDDILLEKIKAENKRRLIDQQILELKNKIEVNYDKKHKIQQRFLDKQSRLEQEIDQMQFMSHKINTNSMVRSVNQIQEQNNLKRQDMIAHIKNVVLEIAELLNLQLPVKYEMQINRQLNKMYEYAQQRPETSSQVAQSIINSKLNQTDSPKRQSQTIKIQNFQSEDCPDVAVYSSQNIPEGLRSSRFQTVSHPQLLFLDCETDQVKDVYMTNNLHDQLKAELLQSKKIPQPPPEKPTYDDGEPKLNVPALNSSFLQNLTASADFSCQVEIKDRKASIQNLKIDEKGNVLEKITTQGFIQTKLRKLNEEMTDFKTIHQFNDEFDDVKNKFKKRLRKATPLEIDLRKIPFQDERNKYTKKDVYYMNMQTADTPPRYEMKLIKECQDGLFIDNQYVPDAAKKLKQLTYEYNQLRAMYDTYMRASNFNVTKKLQVKIKQHLHEMQKLNTYIAKEEQKIKERRKQEMHMKQVLKQARARR